MNRLWLVFVCIFISGAGWPGGDDPRRGVSGGMSDPYTPPTGTFKVVGKVTSDNGTIGDIYITPMTADAVAKPFYIRGTDVYPQTTTNTTGGNIFISAGNPRVRITISAFGADADNDIIRLASGTLPSEQYIFTAKNGGAAGAYQFDCVNSTSICATNFIAKVTAASLNVSVECSDVNCTSPNIYLSEKVGMTYPASEAYAEITNSAGAVIGTVTTGVPGKIYMTGTVSRMNHRPISVDMPGPDCNTLYEETGNAKTLTLPRANYNAAGCCITWVNGGTPGVNNTIVITTAPDVIYGACVSSGGVVYMNGVNSISNTDASHLIGDSVTACATRTNRWYITQCNGTWTTP